MQRPGTPRAAIYYCYEKRPHEFQVRRIASRQATLGIEFRRISRLLHLRSQHSRDKLRLPIASADKAEKADRPDLAALPR